MYFKFKIPEIYSHTVDGKVRDFKWISRLGEYIIDEARFFIGAKEINKLYSWYNKTKMYRYLEK